MDFDFSLYILYTNFCIVKLAQPRRQLQITFHLPSLPLKNLVADSNNKLQSD